MRQQTFLLAAMVAICASWSSHVRAQAGISTQPGAMPTGTVGSNKGAVEAVQCPAGTLLTGVLHRDIRMDIPIESPNYDSRGMTGRLGLYCSRISTDGTSVTVQQTTASGTPVVAGFSYGDADITQNAYCPTGQVTHQMGGWDRPTPQFPWTSAVRLACRPLQLNANSWMRVNTGAAASNADAGNVEANATHTLRGPFCSGTDQTAIVSGYHRQDGGLGYDGINVYCGGLQQARLSAVLTFTDFAWNQTLGGTGWLVNLQRLAATLDDGGGNQGAGRTPHASIAANTGVFQSGREIYVVPNTGYGAQVAQRPSGIATNTHVLSGTCASGITLANEQDASCTMAVNGLPDIGVRIATTPLNYDSHGQAQNFTVTGTNYGPGAVAGSDGFSLVTTLPAGWTATAVPGCTVAGQVVTCPITSAVSAAATPGGSGGSVSFTFPVTVNAPTASGTYTASLALGRSTPDGDADPTNHDYTTGNDTASGSLVLALSSRVTIRKTSVNGIGSFTFSGSNGIPDQTLATVTAGTPVNGTAQVLTATNTATTITEGTPPANYLLTDITCTGLPAGGTATPNLASRQVVLNAAATVEGANVTCTFTNTLQLADIRVVKTATPQPALSGNVVTFTLVVTNDGPAAAPGTVLTDTPGVGLDCTAPSTTFTCSATGGAGCPSGTVPVSTLLGSGMTIPSLPAGGQVTVTLLCRVTATGLP